jgi:vancomycin resistance protein VanW
MSNILISRITYLLHNHLSPKRTALSKKYPFLKKTILAIKKHLHTLKNLQKPIAKTKQQEMFSCILVRHQSVLRRQLGDSDPRLQDQKVINLKKAAEKLNGLVIHPGEIFSFWETIGEPSYANGFVDGMLLSGGKVVEGAGGGLCQMANLLCWMFLHLPVEIVERYHHSIDVFPDSGRVIPFGSGATVMYNFIDLQINNILFVPLQLHVWVEEKYLKGRILSPQYLPSKWHVEEKEHTFVKHQEQFFRYNQIWRIEKKQGKEISSVQVFENFAPVLYQLAEDNEVLLV